MAAMANQRKQNSSRPSLADVAYRRLKKEILGSQMPPGVQALEVDLADRLGMSRTPVREALIQLKTEGLVELIPRKGMRVLATSIADMKEIYELLTALEPEAAGMIASAQPSPNQLRALEVACSEMEEAVGKPDLELWAVADDQFHRSLMDLCENRRLVDVVQSLYDQAHRARMMTLYLRDVPVQSTKEHRQILQHIKNGKTEAARTAFREHRLRVAKELVACLERCRINHV